MDYFFQIVTVDKLGLLKKLIELKKIYDKDNSFLNHTGENPQGWGYAVFGKVTEGMDVVDKIADVATGSSGGHQDVPVDLITIESVTVSE